MHPELHDFEDPDHVGMTIQVPRHDDGRPRAAPWHDLPNSPRSIRRLVTFESHPPPLIHRIEDLPPPPALPSLAWPTPLPGDKPAYETFQRDGVTMVKMNKRRDPGSSPFPPAVWQGERYPYRMGPTPQLFQWLFNGHYFFIPEDVSPGRKEMLRRLGPYGLADGASSADLSIMSWVRELPGNPPRTPYAVNGDAEFPSPEWERGVLPFPCSSSEEDLGGSDGPVST